MSAESGKKVLDIELKHAFDEFTLDVKLKTEGKISVLFGPSGAGKTLTLRCIAGLMRPQSGHVIFGKEVFFSTGESAKWIEPNRRRIGYVFQHHALFPHMTVLENILYGAVGLSRNEATRDATNFMRDFELSGLENHWPKQISGGQKQRVAFARALMARPNLLLLDEPFSALDSKSRAQMQAHLKRITSELALPVVLVTHDQEEARILGDNCFNFEKGRVKNQSRRE